MKAAKRFIIRKCFPILMILSIIVSVEISNPLFVITANGEEVATSTMQEATSSDEGRDTSSQEEAGQSGQESEQTPGSDSSAESTDSTGGGEQGTDNEAIEETSVYPSNLQNGGFELQEFHNQGITGMHVITPETNVNHWHTTQTDSKIEIGWIASDASAHMKDVVEKAAADGDQFAETVADQAGSLYQTFDIMPNETCSWSFAHRGRDGNDVLAYIIGPSQENSPDKAAEKDNDPFQQMVSYIRENLNVETPEAGSGVKITLYTPKFNSEGGFTGNIAVPFSLEEDSEHTEKWTIWLVTSNKDEWYRYKGTYTPKDAQTAVMLALTPYYSASPKNNNTSGNLIDAFSFVDGSGKEKLVNGSMESPAIKTKYAFNSTANSTSPAAGVGWSSTATTKKLELGNLQYGNAYNIGVTYKSKIYVREGKQFAELNAHEASTLYQYISTKPGKRYDWSLSHRGRDGIDTMALIIGPKQAYDPKKVTSKGRDQLMQITDWLKNQSDVIIDVGKSSGCSQKVVIYTSQFDDNGGFTTNDPFSWVKDEEHTEMWNVWIISSDNDRWYDYGTISDSSEGDSLPYNYSYIVPSDVDTSIFSFVSYEPAPRADTGTIDYSYGNLLDCIDFKEYYHIKADTTPNGFGNYTNLDDSVDEDFFSDSNYSGWAISESEFKIVANVESRKFLGAIINGSFIDVSEWQKENDGQYIYIVNSVETHYNIRLIFAAEHVVYDVNGGDPYHYDNTEDTGYEVPLSNRDNVYESHPATSSKDGWRFMGWQYTDPDSRSYLYDGIHTIFYDFDELEPANDMLRINGNLTTGEPCEIDAIAPEDGITMVAQWKYRQRYATQLYNAITGEYEFNRDCGSYSVNINSSDTVDEENFSVEGSVVGGDHYVNDDNSIVNITASPSEGYTFAGWYTPNGRLVSNSRSYTYSVSDRDVVTLYARFDLIGSDINITKTVEGIETDEYFAFHVSLTGLVPENRYKITGINTDPITISSVIVRNPSYIEADSSGEYEGVIYLKDTDTATLNHLPQATEYRITENDYSEAGYKTENRDSRGNLENGSVDITVTNTHSGVPLTIRKEVKGNLGDRQTGFKFEISFSDLIEGEEYVYFLSGRSGKQKLSFTAPESGMYTVSCTMKADEYLYFPSMTDGATYTVKEAASNHTATYRIISQESGSTILEGGNSSAGSDLITHSCSVSKSDGPSVATVYNERSLATVTGIERTGLILKVITLIGILILCLLYVYHRFSRDRF